MYTYCAWERNYVKQTVIEAYNIKVLEEQCLQLFYMMKLLSPFGLVRGCFYTANNNVRDVRKSIILLVITAYFP